MVDFSPTLLGKMMVYSHYSGTITNSAFFNSQNCLGLDNRINVHPKKNCDYLKCYIKSIS